MGFHVQTTESYWSLLLTKHHEIAGRESDVQETLRSNGFDQGSRTHMADVRMIHDPIGETLGEENFREGG